jgi:hypothetical protein
VNTFSRLEILLLDLVDIQHHLVCCVVIVSLCPASNSNQLNSSLVLVCLPHQASTCNSEEQMGLLNLIQDLTHCPPLVTALHTLFKRQCLLLSHRVAISEGLFFLFRELIPRDPSQVSKTVSVGDAYVFESSATCWAYLLSEIKVNYNGCMCVLCRSHTRIKFLSVLVYQYYVTCILLNLVSLLHAIWLQKLQYIPEQSVCL